jgi:lysozyme family protein
MTFDEAFQLLIGNEGGLSMDQKDRGNWTGGRAGAGVLKGSKYGISAMSYPDLDIANLSIEQAKAIYARDFWSQAGCDMAPDGIRFDLFDMAVNSGPRPARMCLQSATGVIPDGLLGDKSKAAIAALDPQRLIARFNGARLKAMTDMAAWPDQGRGWARRIATNLLRA